MEAAEFDDCYERLLATLAEVAGLLAAHDEQHWATWISTDRARIENGDRHGLDHLLSAFGGMGSLNDVLLPDAAANSRLRHLCTTAHTDATALLRDLDHSARLVASLRAAARPPVRPSTATCGQPHRDSPRNRGAPAHLPG